MDIELWNFQMNYFQYLMTDTMTASGDLIATQKAFKQLIGGTLTVFISCIWVNP